MSGSVHEGRENIVEANQMWIWALEAFFPPWISSTMKRLRHEKFAPKLAIYLELHKK